MVVGIPRSFFYYKYHVLIESFFNELNIKYIVSDNSNINILNDGISLAPSESCISLKLFLGHVKSICNKCDYLFIPRLECIRKSEKMCTNFYLLPDLVRNLFDKEILKFNVNLNKKISFKSAFIELGIFLGYSYSKSSIAYKNALEKYNSSNNSLLLDRINTINSNNKKILIVGHSYNIRDDLIGIPITSILEKNGFSIVYADICDIDKDNDLSSLVYFSYNKDLLKVIDKYKEYVDGIILISAFPCGPDSIVNELIIRSIKDIPLISLIIDEENSITGITTRLESFIDIVNKEASYEE